MTFLYIDPGTGALIINLFIALGTTIIFYSKNLFYWIFNIKKNKSVEKTSINKLIQ